VNGSDKVLMQAREAAARFPWYATLLTGSETTMEQLPLLTESMLQKYHYDSPPEDAFSLASYSTSGTSTGRRKTIYYSEEDERQYIGIKADIFRRWLGCGPEAPRRVLSDMGTGHAAATALEVFGQLGVQGESVSFELPILRHVEKLETYMPDVLYTMPSILDRIVHAAAGEPARFGIRKVILVGEIASPSWQRRTARLLGISSNDILDTYGSIEIGTIASYSHEIGRYVVAEGLYAESVGAEELKEGFEPLAPGERVLVLTSFVRDAFPAVRYVTYDVVRDFRTEKLGGVSRQTFEAIVKRIGPELKHGEKISLYDIEEVVLRYAQDAGIYVAVHDRLLTVALQSPSLDPAMLPKIKHDLENKIPAIGTMIRGQVLAGMDITLSADEGPPAPASGMKSRKIHYRRA
jgi:phenylacetate-coenzyme A ligase PaaK-like adenylate-forming protein